MGRPAPDPDSALYRHAGAGHALLSAGAVGRRCPCRKSARESAYNFVCHRDLFFSGCDCNDFSGHRPDSGLCLHVPGFPDRLP